MISQSVTAAFIMFIGLTILLFRLPGIISILILKYRALTDIATFIGSFFLFNAFSNSMTAIITAFALSLFVTAALEINGKYKLIEKLILRNLNNTIAHMYRLKESYIDDIKQFNKAVKRINKLENRYERLVRISRVEA